MREFERADLDHNYMLQKFECAVILRYIDPINKKEFDDLEEFYENSIGYKRTYKETISALWGKVRSMRAPNTRAQQTSISAKKRLSVKIKKQIEELNSDEWLTSSENIAWQIKEACKAGDDDITRDLIENYERRKQEEKYKEWSRNNVANSNRVDQIFNV